ncbi:unnamed protein product [Prorocentrum cordatum]|uniref:Uncharacterized protein n=1 Tax=Prorocentrum cordatum TaxID=2364126 RepID=A0ABN9UJ12_9DINO|nr:unnamed protein product [Polarella glacialis]
MSMEAPSALTARPAFADQLPEHVALTTTWPPPRTPPSSSPSQSSAAAAFLPLLPLLAACGGCVPPRQEVEPPALLRGLGDARAAGLRRAVGDRVKRPRRLDGQRTMVCVRRRPGAAQERRRVRRPRRRRARRPRAAGLPARRPRGAAGGAGGDAPPSSAREANERATAELDKLARYFGVRGQKAVEEPPGVAVLRHLEGLLQGFRAACAEVHEMQQSAQGLAFERRSLVRHTKSMPAALLESAAALLGGGKSGEAQPGGRGGRGLFADRRPSCR